MCGRSTNSTPSQHLGTRRCNVMQAVSNRPIRRMLQRPHDPFNQSSDQWKTQVVVKDPTTNQLELTLKAPLLWDGMGMSGSGGTSTHILYLSKNINTAM